MKKIMLLMMLLSVASSCHFLRKVETEKVPATSNPQSYDGTYLNRIDEHNALWPMLTNGKSKDSTGTITIRTLDKNTLLISHSRISSRYHSYLIKGSLKKTVSNSDERDVSVVFFRWHGDMNVSRSFLRKMKKEKSFYLNTIIVSEQ